MGTSIASGALHYFNNPTLLGSTIDYKVIYAAVVCATLALFARYRSSPWRQLPPGPKGLPVVGNIFQLLAPNPWLTFTEWRKQYGDLIYINIAGQPMVILGSQKVAADLLDRRASIYSDRPDNVVASKILTGGLFIVFTGYSEIWRKLRRAAHEGLYRGAAKKYFQTHQTEATILTSQMIQNPVLWSQHFHRTSSSTIMSILYDHKPILQPTTPQIEEINNCVSRLTKAALPGAFLVEFFPWMERLPDWLAKWKRDAKFWYESDTRMFEGLFYDVRKRMEAGEDRPSVVQQLIQEKDKNQLTLRQNAWLAGTMFSAGAETSSVVMSWWLLAMMLYPDVQKRCQQEIDSVVGRSRLPTFADQEFLPYTVATVKEALRWRPVDPLGLPHRSTEDDWYEGHFIPKGTILVANVWSLNRDPDIYGPDAHHFNPARHLDENGQVGPGPADTKEEGHATYGFGRRICVGRHLANNSLFMNVAMLLWAVNIEHPKDANGDPVPVDIDGCEDHGLVVAPVPFTPKMTPRFPEATVLIEQEMELLGLRE